MSASLDGVCLLHPRPPSSPPISNAKQKRSVASLPPTAHFRANLRELSSLSTRKWIGWFRKQKPQKRCTPAPARSLSRRLVCAVVPSSTSGANYWGVVFFLFFLRSTNMSPSSKPAATQLCGNRVIAGGSLLRVLLTLRLKQETVPPFSQSAPPCDNVLSENIPDQDECWLRRRSLRIHN